MRVFKRTSEMNPAEIELQEIRQLVRELRAELTEIQPLIELIRVEAQISHCLIVVRKIGEDKLEVLSKLLD